MWWREIDAQPSPCSTCDAPRCLHVDESATIASDAILDTSAGPIVVGARTCICSGANIRGPVCIGDDCLIGNLTLVRGPATVGNGSRIGFATEIKNSIIGERVAIGPQCFVADSKVEDDAYLGAQVRTSNHRLDRQNVAVLAGDELVDSGREKLGCLIGARAALGIQVIVLPGRIVAPDSIIGPRITVEKNLPSGRYRLPQSLETY